MTCLDVHTLYLHIAGHHILYPRTHLIRSIAASYLGLHFLSGTLFRCRFRFVSVFSLHRSLFARLNRLLIYKLKISLAVIRPFSISVSHLRLRFLQTNHHLDKPKIIYIKPKSFFFSCYSCIFFKFSLLCHLFFSNHDNTQNCFFYSSFVSLQLTSVVLSVRTLLPSWLLLDHILFCNCSPFTLAIIKSDFSFYNRFLVFAFFHLWLSFNTEMGVNDLLVGLCLRQCIPLQAL